MLELAIHMDNGLLHCGIENRTPCCYSSLYLSILLSFAAEFVSQFSAELGKLESSNMVYQCRMSDCVSQFSPELGKLESSNMVYQCRMSDCIVGWRLRDMAFIFYFSSIILSFPKLQVNIKNVYRSFLRKF